MPNNIGAYAKSIAYMVAAALSFLAVALMDNVLTLEEKINLGIAIAGAGLVFAVPNLPGGVIREHLKTIIAALIAGATLLVSLLADGVSSSEWMQVGLAVLGGLGVYIIPNEEPPALAYVEHYEGTP
jgi:hypothetical protein